MLSCVTAPNRGSDGRAIRKRRKAALTHRLIAVHLRCVGLIHRARADILRAQIDRVADLVFQREAPLHEIGRVQLAVRHGRNRDRLQTGIRIGKRRCAGELALREAGIEGLIRRDGRIDGAVRHARRNRRSADRSQQAALKRLRVRRIHAHQVDHASRQQIAEQTEAGPQTPSSARSARQSPFSAAGWRAALKRKCFRDRSGSVALSG